MIGLSVKILPIFVDDPVITLKIPAGNPAF